MAVKSKEELLTSIKSLLGEDITDDGIALLEDISDTLDNSTSGSSDDDKKTIEELKQQVKDVDSMWRRKYTDRFLNPTSKDDSVDEPSDDVTSDDSTEEENSPKNFEDLFNDET